MGKPMRRVLHLKGGPALSDFRIDKLLAALKPAGVAGLVAEYRYFVELAREPDADDLAFLGELLHAEPHTAEADVVLVVPRLGTVSPWSSKATDIAANCGLQAVLRIERGVCWQLFRKKGRRLAPETIQAALPLLHDRMTESVLFDEVGAEQLFHHQDLQRRVGHRRQEAGRIPVRHDPPHPSGAAARHWSRPTPTGAWRCRRTRSTTW